MEIVTLEQHPVVSPEMLLPEGKSVYSNFILQKPSCFVADIVLIDICDEYKYPLDVIHRFRTGTLRADTKDPFSWKTPSPASILYSYANNEDSIPKFWKSKKVVLFFGTIYSGMTSYGIEYSVLGLRFVAGKTHVEEFPILGPFAWDFGYRQEPFTADFALAAVSSIEGETYKEDVLGNYLPMGYF
jgi:hypothetical protein